MLRGDRPRKVFEAVAKFEEGKVPCEELKELFATTNSLVDELKKLKNAPTRELESVGVAFRKSAILWKDNHAEPLMDREIYLEKHFEQEKTICDRLEKLHDAYVRIYAAKGRKKATFSAASQMEDDSGKAKERRVIFAEIDRLVNLGNSIPKAIAIMKRGSYEARMRGVKAETWKRYYVGHCRKRELGRRKNETVKSKRKSVKGCHKIIMRLIKRRPGVTVKEILFQVGKSRATVMRYIADLKDSREIEYRGAAKSGGYYVVG